MFGPDIQPPHHPQGFAKRLRLLLNGEKDVQRCELVTRSPPGARKISPPAGKAGGRLLAEMRDGRRGPTADIGFFERPLEGSYGAFHNGLIFKGKLSIAHTS